MTQLYGFLNTITTFSSWSGFEDHECGFQKSGRIGAKTEGRRRGRLIADQTAVMKTDVPFAAMAIGERKGTPSGSGRLAVVAFLVVTDLAVECVGVLQRGEAVGLCGGVGPSASSAGIAASSARCGGPPAVLAAVGELTLKEENGNDVRLCWAAGRAERLQPHFWHHQQLRAAQGFLLDTTTCGTQTFIATGPQVRDGEPQQGTEEEEERR